MKKRSLIARRLTAVTFAILLLILAAAVLILSVHTNSTIEKTIGSQGIHLGEQAASFIDKEDYQKFAENPEKNETYWAIRKQLNELKQHIGAKYLYTVRIENDKVQLLVDGEEKDATELGEFLPAISNKQVSPALEGKPAFTEIIDDPEFGKYLSVFVPITSEQGEVIGVLGLDIPAEQVDSIQSETLKQTLPFMIGLLIVIILLACFILYYSINRSLQPLSKLNTGLDELAKGRIGEALNSVTEIKIKKEDEIQTFTANFTATVSHLKKMIESIYTSSSAFMNSAKELAAEVQSVKAANEEIVSHAHQMAKGSQVQMTNHSESAQAMEEMAIGVQRIAESSSSIAETSNGVTELVDNSYTQTKAAVAEINDVKASVIKSNEEIKDLGDKFKNIEEMVSVISSISEQTNLLALNASIEAARAGDHGKGFAVVANEVKKLAEESTVSAKHITELVRGLQAVTDEVIQLADVSTKKVESGTKTVMDVGESLQHIRSSIHEVNHHIQEVSAVTEELSAGSEEVVASMDSMADISKNNADQASQVAAACDQQKEAMNKINESNKRLLQLCEGLEKTVEKFSL
ncbi:methyl-accepting chemotaxis protein [Bacillus xiapuensis]|uniref:methyl-accepting chemotaxis protein n=1 Tax=Bacillus xiapuensis TaxID=2014075 RepID=UPI000C23A248|nr:methyl-accepting chemotaxis protein [Bacillus xiapuensis]